MRRKSAEVVPLITKREYELLWETLDVAVEGGAFEDDPAIEAEYRRLRAKLAVKAGKGHIKLAQ